MDVLAIIKLFNQNRPMFILAKKRPAALALIVLVALQLFSPSYAAISTGYDQETEDWPLFVGLRMAKMSKDYLYYTAISTLKGIYERFPEAEILKDINSIVPSYFQNKTWVYPLETHITGYYVAKVAPADP